MGGRGDGSLICFRTGYNVASGGDDIPLNTLKGPTRFGCNNNKKDNRPPTQDVPLQAVRLDFERSMLWPTLLPTRLLKTGNI